MITYTNDERNILINLAEEGDKPNALEVLREMLPTADGDWTLPNDISATYLAKELDGLGGYGPGSEIPGKLIKQDKTTDEEIISSWQCPFVRLDGEDHSLLENLMSDGSPILNSKNKIFMVHVSELLNALSIVQAAMCSDEDLAKDSATLLLVSHLAGSLNAGVQTRARLVAIKQARLALGGMDMEALAEAMALMNSKPESQEVH